MAKKLVIDIKAPNMRTLALTIEGTELYVQHKFSSKVRTEMEEKHKAGSTAKTTRAREKKDFTALYNEAMHLSADGWHGLPAAAFRKAMISACRLVGFQMTLAKLAVFIQADGHSDDGTALVKITKGKPYERHDPVRNDNGSPDIRSRPAWNPGWRATLRIRYDADIFTDAHIVNLLARVGEQVGIGEGRPDSKDSAGMDWGKFRILGQGEK